MSVTDRFPGRVLIIAPHMDDEVLACGGLMALLPDKQNIHIVYATDGMKSPAPVIPWRDSISPDLGAERMKESERAVGLLGVPPENLHFLNLPEAELSRHIPALTRLLTDKLRELKPEQVLVPFRFDRHPDHLAINRVATSAYRKGMPGTRLTEYFVYYRWRLLPKRDIRKYIRPDHLFSINIDEVASSKRNALDCFKSQTTRFYPWQTRPILTHTLLDEECANPEVFLEYDESTHGTRVFDSNTVWIQVVHHMEPFLQKWKYLVKSTFLRALGLEDAKRA